MLKLEERGKYITKVRVGKYLRKPDLVLFESSTTSQMSDMLYRLLAKRKPSTDWLAQW